MRRMNKKSLAIMLTVTSVVVAGVGSQVAYAKTLAQPISTVNRETSISPLASVWNEIPEFASTAVETQEWYKKALLLTDEETDIYTEPADGSTVMGKAYPNSVLMVLEEKDGWTKVSGASLTGYVKSDMVVSGKEALERAKTVCPQYAVVNAGEVELKLQASEDAESKGTASTDVKYAVVEKQDDWITVADEDESEVFVKAEQVTLKRDLKEAMTLEEIEEQKRLEEEARLAEEAAKLEAQRKAEEERKAQEAREAKAKSSPAVSASTDDQTLLAALIYCEAGNQPYEGQVAVGAVVLNRVRSGRFPNSIREVIYQSGQFGPAITGKLERVLANGTYSSTQVQAAADALAGANPIGDALFFGNGNYGQLIGDHYFH